MTRGLPPRFLILPLYRPPKADVRFRVPLLPFGAIESSSAGVRLRESRYSGASANTELETDGLAKFEHADCIPPVRPPFSANSKAHLNSPECIVPRGRPLR
jgi:hypothetical protein